MGPFEHESLESLESLENMDNGEISGSEESAPPGESQKVGTNLQGHTTDIRQVPTRGPYAVSNGQSFTYNTLIQTYVTSPGPPSDGRSAGYHEAFVCVLHPLKNAET